MMSVSRYVHMYRNMSCSVELLHIVYYGFIARYFLNPPSEIVKLERCWY